MSVQWRAPIYDHGILGPLGADAMARFDLVEVPQRQSPGHYVHARCPCGRFAATSRNEMLAHLGELNGCLIRRTQMFWHSQPDFMSISGTNRFSRVALESGVEVWRDVSGRHQLPKRSEVLGVRVGTMSKPKYQLYAERWAWRIVAVFEPNAGRGAQKHWLKANKGDWLLRAVLRRAKHNLEFRSAVTGLQRLSSDPWVQYDAFQGWMKNSDTSNAKNM